MLSSWGIVFEAVNVKDTPGALEELKRLGAPLVPAVAVDERIVHGWNPRGLAELLGVSYAEPIQLSPKELVGRLEQILLATQRALQQTPPETIRARTPGGERTLRDIGHHIFRLTLGFRDAALEDRFPETWLLELPSAELTTGSAIAAYGSWVWEEIAQWFSAYASEDFARSVQTYYGPQSLHALLERTTWHAAQHLRQVYTLLESAGIGLDQPLTAADYAGLPLPSQVW